MTKLVHVVADWNADARYETNSDFYISGGEAEDIVGGNKFLIIGRKGTGKTALAKYISYTYPSKLVNFDRFRYQHIFPFHEKDYEDSSKYIDIWIYVIYASAVSVIGERYPWMIDKGSVADKIIKNSSSIKGDTRPLLVRMLEAIGVSGIGANLFGGGGNVAFGKNAGSISGVSVKEINMRIQNFFESISSRISNNIYVLIDNLDQDLDSQAKDKDEYKFLISSFIKAVEFTRASVAYLRPVIFMREDIFFSLSKTSKWGDVRLRMSWTHARIHDLLVARIRQSTEVVFGSDEEALGALFLNPEIRNASKKRSRVVDYLIEYSQMRPRDIIGYIKIVAAITKDAGYAKIGNEAIKDAQADYSDFIAEGVKEELEWHFDQVDRIYDAITECGSPTFKYGAISNNLKRHLKCDEKVAFDIVTKLHRFGVLGNHYNMKKYFIFTDPKIDIDISREIVVHCSIQKRFGF